MSIETAEDTRLAEALTFKLRRETYEALRQVAHERRESLGEVTRQAIDFWLANQNISLK